MDRGSSPTRHRRRPGRSPAADRGPTAETRTHASAELAALRAAEAPLTEAQRARVEARLDAASVGPDLRAACAEVPGLAVGVLLMDAAVARAVAPLMRQPEPLPAPGPLGMIYTIVSASDVAALAADLALPAPPAGPGVPLLFDVDGHRGSRRLLFVEVAR